MNKGFTVEYGAFERVCDEFYYPRGIEFAFKQQEINRSKGVPISVVPYNGVRDTVLASARRTPIVDSPSIEMLKIGTAKANELGMGLKVAMNGGLQIPGQIDLVNDPRFRNDLQVLELLAEEGAKNGVQNIVAVYRNEVLEVVRNLFPNLLVAASTIRYAVPRTEEEHEKKYREDLAIFDQVVPIPQHTTSGFLRKFKEDADKLVIFPFLRCAQPDLTACQLHYNEVYSGLDSEYKQNPNKDCRKCTGEALFSREEDAKKVIALGVSNFKLARNDSGNGLSSRLKEIANIYLLVQRRIERAARLGGI